jgi:hypothetical protein
VDVKDIPSIGGRKTARTPAASGSGIFGRDFCATGSRAISLCAPIHRILRAFPFQRGPRRPASLQKCPTIAASVDGAPPDPQSLSNLYRNAPFRNGSVISVLSAESHLIPSSVARPVGARVGALRAQRLHDDFHVEIERPVLNIMEIIFNPPLHRLK